MLKVSSSSLRYMPALDGLRALAVLIVITFHVIPLSLPGGFLGVDIFFVLSGYLITSLILVELREKGSFSFKNFYYRRLLRLMPALLLLILILFLLTAMWPSFPGTFSGLLEETGWAMTYLTNWARAFGHYPSPSFLPHTWSLAVEEQFYLIWPLAFLILYRICNQESRRLCGAIAGVILVVWAWRWWLLTQGYSIDRIYNGLDTRADALMWGALLAVYLASGAPLLTSRLSAGCIWVAICWVLYMTWAANWESPFHYLVPLPLFYLAIVQIIVVLSRPETKGLLVRLLSVGVLRYTGKISYGLYLWHFPVLRVFLPYELPSFQLLAFVMVFTFVLASLSWHLVETYFLAKKHRFQALGHYFSFKRE